MHIPQYENFMALRCCGGTLSGITPFEIKGMGRRVNFVYVKHLVEQ